MRPGIFAVLVFCLVCSVASCAQQNSNVCPAEITSVHLLPYQTVVGTRPTLNAPPQGKLSFKYRNLSSRDIRSITLGVLGSIPVSGPAGPSFMRSKQDVVVEGRLESGKSKSKSIKLSLASWSGLRVELVLVKFADGTEWANDAGLQCVQ